MNAVDSGKPATVCQYFSPPQQAGCRTELATASAKSMESFKGFSLGYIAIRGKQALVGFTGTFCSPGLPPSAR